MKHSLRGGLFIKVVIVWKSYIGKGLMQTLNLRTHLKLEYNKKKEFSSLVPILLNYFTFLT